MSTVCGMKRHFPARWPNLIALAAVCLSMFALYYCICGGLERALSKSELSGPSERNSGAIKVPKALHVVTPMRENTSVLRLMDDSLQNQAKGETLTLASQQADLVKWIQTFVKSAEQLSVVQDTVSDPAPSRWQSISSRGDRSQGSGGVLNKTTVPGLFLHGNWHWTITRQGQYDPEIFSPPEGELPAQRLPKAIIIGAGMCGTRALLAYLDLHPNIVAEAREMDFFSHDENFVRGLSWYRASMPLSYSNQVTIEKSPSYFVSWRAPAEIYGMDRAVKLILVVKDPVERVLTQAGKMENPDNHERLYLKTTGSRLAVRNASNTVSGGLYATHLRKWLVYFPLKQIHIVEGLDLVTAPAREIHKLETFLAVPHVLTSHNFVYNASKGFFCLRPVYSPHGARARCLGDRKGVRHPRMRAVARRMMYDFYEPHNEEFFKLIGRRFDWEP